MRNVTANLLSNVCNDVDIEPKLLPVTGQNLSNRTTNTRTEARRDITSVVGGGGVGGGFWVRGRQVFFNIRLFEPNAKRYPNSALSKCCAQNEKEEKKQ